MHDLRFIRENPQEFDKAMERRGFSDQSSEILKMDIVVEGVETKEQLKLIDTKSFVKIQGYYFYKPMPIQEFLSII